MGVGNDGEGGTRSRDNARRHTNVGTHGGAVRCGVCAWAWRVGPGDEGALVELEGRTARPKPHPQRTAALGTVSHEGPCGRSVCVCLAMCAAWFRLFVLLLQ